MDIRLNAKLNVITRASLGMPVISIDWDGETKDLKEANIPETIVANGITLYKVSDEIIKPSQILGQTFTYKQDNETKTLVLDDTNVFYGKNYCSIVELDTVSDNSNIVMSNMYMLSADNKSITILQENIELPETGTYFIKTDSVQSVSIETKYFDTIKEYLDAEDDLYVDVLPTQTVILYGGNASTK